MHRLLPFLLGGSYGATTLSNVACNGKDQISFTLTKDAGSALGAIQTLGCSNQDGTLDSSVYTQNGDIYNFAFNPYTSCVTAPDPNDASTYSVDFKMLFSDATTIGGQTMYFSGDQIELKCTFQSTYTLTSDLGGVNLEGDQLVGEEFKLDFAMTRTQSDYTTAETGDVVANSMIYHTITSTTMDNLAATDFSFVPSSIRLEKKNSNLAFNLWSSDMTSCGYTEVNFVMGYDSTAKKWTFEYRGFLLDTEQGAEYQLVADMELCNSLSTDAKCTAASDQCLAVTSVDIPTPVGLSSISGYTMLANVPVTGGIYSMVRAEDVYIILTGQGTIMRSATAPYDLITDSRRDSIFNSMSEGYNRVYTIAWSASKQLLIIAGSYNVYVFNRESNGEFTKIQDFASGYRVDSSSNVHIAQIDIDGDRAHFYCQHYKDNDSNQPWVANIEIYDINADNTLTHFKSTGDDLDGADRYDAMDYNAAYIVGYTSETRTIRLYNKDGEEAKTFDAQTSTIWGIKIIGNYIIIGTAGTNGKVAVNLYNTDGDLIQEFETNFGVENDHLGQLTVDGNIIFVSQRTDNGVTVLKLENELLTRYGPVHSSYNRAGEMDFNIPASFILIDTQAQPTRILGAHVGYSDFRVWQVDP